MIETEFERHIGTAQDNRSEPIHDWYRFTAGFSYKLVDTIISNHALSEEDCIYEPFAGCGTTLVTSQKRNINAIGNEGQKLLYNVIKAKLEWKLNEHTINDYSEFLTSKTFKDTASINFHPLLLSLYTISDLQILYGIKDLIKLHIKEEGYANFFNLALTQTLHRVSIHPISVPYISRNKTLVRTQDAMAVFIMLIEKMKSDLNDTQKVENLASIHLHDSRIFNNDINDNACTISITSPPYLNNLDYGEISKVCSHFFGHTSDNAEVTAKVRKNLVTGSTTHFRKADFDFETFIETRFASENSNVIDQLLPIYRSLKQQSAVRKGKKSFHILAMYYFSDMFAVLLEMRRILANNSKAYLVLGDSAPYGCYINTTRLLGEIGINCGFSSFKMVKLRDRGSKWAGLKYRHHQKLSESILILE